jgi:hypothetical protein
MVHEIFHEVHGVEIANRIIFLGKVVLHKKLLDDALAIVVNVQEVSSVVVMRSRIQIGHDLLEKLANNEGHQERGFFLALALINLRTNTFFEKLEQLQKKIF